MGASSESVPSQQTDNIGKRISAVEKEAASDLWDSYVLPAVLPVPSPMVLAVGGAIFAISFSIGILLERGKQQQQLDATAAAADGENNNSNDYLHRRKQRGKRRWQLRLREKLWTCMIVLLGTAGLVGLWMVLAIATHSEQTLLALRYLLVEYQVGVVLYLALIPLGVVVGVLCG